MSRDDPDRLLAQASRHVASGRPVLRLIYLGSATLLGLGLVGYLYLRGRLPEPEPAVPGIPRPEDLSPEDRAAWQRAEQAFQALIVAAVASRIWTVLPPEEGGWTAAAAGRLQEPLSRVPSALEECGWTGHLRVIDCRREPCVAIFEGGEAPAGECAAWPEAIEVWWAAPAGRSADTGE